MLTLINGLLTAAFNLNLKKLTIERTSRDSKLVQYLERKMPALDATRVCVSFAEAKFGRLFFKPLTVPGRIWMSWKGAKLWGQFKSNSSLSSKTDQSKLSVAFMQGGQVTNKRSRKWILDSNMIGPKSNAIFLQKCNGGISAVNSLGC